MKKILKSVAVCLSVVLMAGGFAGCRQGESVSGERKTLRVSIFERGNIPAGAGSITNNAMTQWIQKEFGEKNNVNVEFVAIPRSQEVQQLNVLLSAGEAPDIIFTYDYSLLYNYYKQGGLCDLTQYMGDANQLSAFMGEEQLQKGQFDGKQILIPGKTLMVGTFAQVIRQDWLDTLGLPVPTTTEEFYNTLKAFKEKDPGGMGDKTIPYGLSLHHMKTQNTLINSFVDYDSMTEVEKNCMPELMRPGIKDGFRFMNKLYHEGLISKDFALDKDRKQVEADFSNGYVGFMSDDVGRPLSTGGIYDTLKKTIPEAELSAADTFSDSRGRHTKQCGAGVSLLIAVPQTSKCPEIAVKYLDWMASEDVIITLQNGFEGISYTYNEDGIPIEIISDEAQKTHWGSSLALDLAVIVNGKYMEDPEKRTELAVLTYGDKAELAKQCIENSLTDAWTQKLMTPTDALMKYNSVVNEKAEQIYVKSITAPPEQFDAVYDSLYNEYMQAGQQKIYEETCELYAEMYVNK